MFSAVLASERAIAVNIEIMRAFVRMRELVSSNKELARRYAQLEARIDKKLAEHDEAITAILSAIRERMNPPQRSAAALALPRRGSHSDSHQLNADEAKSLRSQFVTLVRGRGPASEVTCRKRTFNCATNERSSECEIHGP
jgi:hypothetical protein